MRHLEACALAILLVALISCATEPPRGDGPGSGEGSQAVAAGSGEGSAEGSGSGEAEGSAAGSGELEMSPGERAVEDVDQLLGQYWSAIIYARGEAAKQKSRVLITLDRAKSRLTVANGDDGPFKHFPFPTSIKVLKHPKQVWILPDKRYDHSSRHFDPRSNRLPTPETAHVLAHVPGFPTHAYIRFYRGTKDHLITHARYGR